MLTRFAFPLRPKDQSFASRLVTAPLDWYIQPKYNGWHVLALPDGRLFTRHGQNISDWPGVQAIRKALRLTVPVVGELLCGAGHDDVTTLERGGQGKLVVFDLVTRGNFGDRSFALGSLTRTRGVIECAETFLPCKSWDGIRRHLTAELGRGNEGIVLKHRSGLYEVGKGKSVESKWQVKIKNVAALGA